MRGHKKPLSEHVQNFSFLGKENGYNDCPPGSRWHCFYCKLFCYGLTAGLNPQQPLAWPPENLREPVKQPRGTWLRGGPHSSQTMWHECQVWGDSSHQSSWNLSNDRCAGPWCQCDARRAGPWLQNNDANASWQPGKTPKDTSQRWSLPSPGVLGETQQPALCVAGSWSQTRTHSFSLKVCGSQSQGLRRVCLIDTQLAVMATEVQPCWGRHKTLSTLGASWRARACACWMSALRCDSVFRGVC